MHERIRYLVNRLKERLWIRPLAMCTISLLGVFLAKLADLLPLESVVPNVTVESVETLLKVIAASMLVMAVFAVGSMVSAYASASSNATPRAFPLIIADDVSQNALSAFIGAFIFSLVALFSLLNEYYGDVGRFVLLLMTFATFAAVIFTFVWWVDRIARLGRLGATIEKVESATAAAMERRRCHRRLGGIEVDQNRGNRVTVYGDAIGYVQQVSMTELQEIAEELDTRIEVAAIPGIFASPGQPLAYIENELAASTEIRKRIAATFVIGRGRTFDEDPRFGLVVLSEIAARALSPGINDTGSAISVIGALVRLLVLWNEPLESDLNDSEQVLFDRVRVPELDLVDMYDDAFTAIARDGAGTVEVAVRLQKAFAALASVGGRENRHAAKRFARMALARAESAIELPHDLDAIKKAVRFDPTT